MSAARLSDAQGEAIRPHLPARPRTGRPLVADRGAYRERWRVERTFAGPLSCRRVVVGWDRLVGVYRGSVLFALAMIGLRRLLQ